MNLLNETKEILENRGKSLEDVLWCGGKNYGWFTVDDFKKLADVEYDEGFGSVEVAEDLLVVGKDFWLERHEYDGSEWWEYKTLPTKPDSYKLPEKIARLEDYRRKLSDSYDDE